MTAKRQSLKLGKGAAFVKSRRKRLPREDEAWEAGAGEERGGEGESGSRREAVCSRSFTRLAGRLVLEALYLFAPDFFALARSEEHL
jgi:hypothetical protein